MVAKRENWRIQFVTKSVTFCNADMTAMTAQERLQITSRFPLRVFRLRAFLACVDDGALELQNL